MTMFQSLLKCADRSVGHLIATVIRCHPVGKIPSLPGKILFIRPGGIGDAVLLIPAIKALLARFPSTAIDILAERRNASVFALCPGIRSVRRYDVASEFLSVLHSRYNVIIDTEQWHQLSALAARIIRAEVRIGYASNDRRRLFYHSIPYEQDDYESDSFMNLLFFLDCAVKQKADTPYISVPVSDVMVAESHLVPLRGRPFVALFPGASIAVRRWGCDKFASIAERFIQKGIGVVVVGSKAESTDGLAIEAVGGLSLCGLTTIAETAAVIARSSLLVSGDSGILHLAVGLGVPTVSLFGPGRAKKWAPRGDSHIVINKNLPCSPCTTFGYTPKCPINARCMAEITVDEVEQAVLTLLARRNFDEHQQKP